MAVIVVQLSQTTSQKQNTMIRLDPFLIGMDGGLFDEARFKT